MKLPERLPRETGRDYALRVLKENIVNLEIAPGSQISENELSAALGISRAPIREALSELEKVKIVEIQPQKKTSVLLIDPVLVEEARFMRSTLEDAVIGEVCMQMTEQDLFTLEENLTLQDLAFRSNALDQVMIKDNEFHRYFFEISRKPEIYQLIIEKYRLDPAHSVFIDDMAVNIEGAKAAGLKTIHLPVGGSVLDYLTIED